MLCAFKAESTAKGACNVETSQQLATILDGIPNNTTSIELIGKYITCLPFGLFTNFSSCTYLNLTRNQIKNITTGAFSGLDKLQSLDLSENFIKEIYKGMFEGLGSLKELNLDNNQIENINDGFHSSGNLTLLSLNGNKFKYIPNVIRTDLTSLLGLSLAGNNLDQYIFSLLNDRMFINLEQLDLSGNEITGLPLWRTLGLKELNLCNNEIRELQFGGFRYLKKLVTLNLSWNDLKRITKHMLEGLHSLEILYLNANKLTEIRPGGFSGLPSLSVLFLHDNKLTTFPQDAFDPHDYPRTSGHPANLTLSIRYNPIECESRLCWLKQANDDGWIQRHFNEYSSRSRSFGCRSVNGLFSTLRLEISCRE